MTTAKASPWRDIVLTTATKFASVPLALATSIMITRGLGPAEKGQYSAALTVVTLVGLLSGFGVGRGLLFVLTRRPDVDASSARRSALAFGIVSGAALVLLICAIAYGGLEHLIPGVRPALVAAAAPIVALTGLRSILEGVARAEERNGVVNLAALVTSLALLVAVAFVWFADELDPAVVLWSRVGSAAVGLGVIAIAVRRPKGTSAGRFESATLRLLLRFGLPYLLVVVAQNMNYDADILLVARYLDDSAVGQYSTAVSVAEFLWYLPMAAGFVLVPRAARHSGRDAASETARVLRVTMGLTSVACVGLLAFGPLVMRVLYGAEYLPAVAPFRLLLPGVIAMTIVQVLSGYLVGRGHLRALVLSSAAAGAANVTLNIVLIPRLGLNAAPIATDVSYLLLAALVIRSFSGLTGLAPSDFLKPDWGALARIARRPRADR